jgi:hypothetical protein
MGYACRTKSPAASVKSPCRRNPLKNTIPSNRIAPCRSAGTYSPRRFRRERKLRSQQLQNSTTDCYITFLSDQRTGISSLLPSALSTSSQITAICRSDEPLMISATHTYTYANVLINEIYRTCKELSAYCSSLHVCGRDIISVVLSTALRYTSVVI